MTQVPLSSLQPNRVHHHSSSTMQLLCLVLTRFNNHNNSSSITRVTNSLSTTNREPSTTILLPRNIIKCLALWFMSSSPSSILNHSLSSNYTSSSKLQDKVTQSTLATLCLVNTNSTIPINHCRCNDLVSSNSSSMDLANNSSNSSSKPPPRGSTKAGWQDLPYQQTALSRCLQVDLVPSSVLSWFARLLEELVSS